MEIDKNIPVPISTKGRTEEYFLGIKVYELKTGESSFFSDELKLDKVRLLSRLQFINYNNKELKKENYRRFVSKIVTENEQRGFRIWRIQ